MATGIKTSRLPKVTPNYNTVETKKFIQNIVNNELTWIEDLLAQLTPKQRVDAVIKLLPYLVPKTSEASIIEP